jgi:hypothetical protein
MTASVTILGVVLIAFMLREVFLDLFHHAQSGTVSDRIARIVFASIRPRPSLLPLAGPLSVVLIILAWFFLLAFGFSLVYWPRWPAQFAVKSLPVDGAFVQSFYFSLETMTTLGYGDISPNAPRLQLVTTVQALVGFALVTASVSWIVLLFPALARLRTLARNVTNLSAAERDTGFRAETSFSDEVLFNLASAVTQVRVDLEHFPIVYYFRSSTRRGSLPMALPCLVRIARGRIDIQRPAGVRLACASLNTSLQELACKLGESFVDADPADMRAVFAAYHEHHRSG